MADLITVDRYKEIEGITSTKEDTKLEIFVPAVSQLVKTYCGNSIVDYYSTTKVETFSINWQTNLVQLTESPVVSLSTVRIRESITEAYKTLQSTEFYLEESTDTVFYINGNNYRNWPEGPGSVKITYNAGYASCPADLELAVADLVTYYLKD